jgi:hypothetical protein
MLPNTLFQTGVIVTIQAQLLTSNSMVTSTISHAILSLGIIFKLLGTMLAISFQLSFSFLLYISSHTFVLHLAVD